MRHRWISERVFLRAKSGENIHLRTGCWAKSRSSFKNGEKWGRPENVSTFENENGWKKRSVSTFEKEKPKKKRRVFTFEKRNRKKVFFVSTFLDKYKETIGLLKWEFNRGGFRYWKLGDFWYWKLGGFIDKAWILVYTRCITRREGEVLCHIKHAT